MNEDGHHQQTIIKYQTIYFEKTTSLPLVIKHGSWKSQNQWEIHWKLTYKFKNSPVFPKVFPVFFRVVPVFSQFFQSFSQFFPCFFPWFSCVYLNFSRFFSYFSQHFPHRFRPPVHIAGGPTDAAPPRPSRMAAALRCTVKGTWRYHGIFGAGYYMILIFNGLV